MSSDVLRFLVSPFADDMDILRIWRIRLAIILAIFLVVLFTALFVFEAIPLWTPLSTPLQLLDQNRDVYIEANVSTTQPELAAQVPVTVRAVGSIGTASAGGSGWENVTVLKNIAMVCLAFSGAHTVLNGQVIANVIPQPTDGAVCLGITKTKPKEKLLSIFGPGEYLAADSQTIEWLNPIESVPSIVIVYWTPTRINGILRMTNTYSDPTQNIHIEPHSSLDATKGEKEFIAITVIWSIFGLVQFYLSKIAKQTQPKLRKIS